MDGSDTLLLHTREVDGQPVHYVDVGTGPVVVLVHGSPVSSYEFRNVIARLQDRFRLIAPDLLGFGATPAPAGGAGFSRQVEALRGLLDQLEIESYDLVVHDWGGPVGAACAVRRPEQLRRLVLVNTTVLPDFRPPLYWRPFILPALGECLLVGLNLFGRGLPLMLRAARERDLGRRYRGPFASVDTRRTVLALERLDGFGALMAEVVEILPTLEVPIHIIWGHPDP